VKVGVWLPVVSAHPGYGAPAWERAAGAAELAVIAKTADEHGYECVCVPEHVALPAGRAQGTRYWDPLSTLGYIAAHTRRVRLVPLVVVLGYHHPLEIVKRYGTLDLISGGRVVLGVGVGGTEREFALLGASFGDRGARADDCIAAIRASAGTTTPVYEGTYYRFSDMVVDPTMRAGTPLWVGGGSRAALRRALRHAQGWAPVGLDPAELAAMLAELDPGNTRAGDFEVAFLPRAEHKVDPLGDPSGTRSFLARLREAGATLLLPRMPSESVSHYADQMAALAGLARDEGGGERR
jgi:probable F420-dependent oxidoreductase